MRYEDASGAFQASGPVANDDSDTLSAGQRGPATGNLITGEGTQYAAAGADSAAGGHITSIAGKGGEDSSFAGGKLSVTGEHGQLSVDAEGNYSYLANQGAPENVRDRFTYTLADNQGNSDTAALIVEIGKTPVVIKADAQQIVPGPDGVVTLPPGVELSDIMVVGRNLVVNLPDGTQLIILDGAVFVPQLQLGGVEVPAANVAALLIGQEPQPAAGETPPSSGGNFALPPPPLDPGVPLGDLIPPTEYTYQPPEPQEVLDAIDNEPTITIEPDGQPASVNAVDSVDEAGLPERNEGEPEGSGEEAAAGANGDPSEATSGVIHIDSPDGPSVVAINGVAVTIVGQVIQGEYGALTITSISDTEIGYSYLLSDNIDHSDGVPDQDDFSVTVTDVDGDQATATLTINIVDDEPTARDDTDAVIKGDTSTDGNVMTGVGTTSAPGGVDTVGADDAEVTGAHAGTSGSFTNVPDGGVLIVGQFGDLTLFPDGSYTYTLHAEVGDGGNDVFTYQLTDGDGDTSDATLTIAVPPDLKPVVGPNPTVLLDDDALPGGNPGGTGDDPDAVNVSGQLSGSGGDGPLTFSVQLTGAPAGFTYVSGGAGIVLIQQGGLTVLTVTVNPDGSYSVEQNNPIDHAAGGDENNQPFTINYTVTDSDGDSANGTLNINVDDDSPVLDEVVSQGDVTLDETDAGSPAGFPISDTSALPVIDFTALFGADGAAAVDSVVLGLVITGGPNSGLQSAVGDFPITLVQIDGDTIEGHYNGSNVAFIIQLNGDGTVTLTQNVPLEHLVDGPPGPDHNDSLDLAGLIAVTVTITDGDGDQASAQAGIGDSLVFLDDGPDAQVDEEATLDTLVLDETRPVGTEEDGDSDPAGLMTVQANFADNFVSPVDFGADGAGTVSYALALNGSEVPSGLYAIQPSDTDAGDGDGYGQGEQIVLNQSGNTITGSAGGVDYFTITIDPVTGVVTFTQLDNIWHGNTGSDDDTSTLMAEAGALLVQQIVTDSDGDFDTASVDVSQGVFQIEDDGPDAANDTDTVGDPGSTATGNVITDAAPGDAGDGDNGADDVGEDQPGTITDLASVNEPGNSDSDPDPDVFEIQGEFGVLVMNADGSYSYTRDANTPGGEVDVFTYTLTDADGDSTTATLTITLGDATPVLPDPDLVQLDDDVIPGADGNVPDGPGDDDPDVVGENVVNGQLNGSGGDGPLTYNFTGINTLPAGFSIDPASDADTLLINQGGTLVMTIQLNQATGAFTVTQNNPIDHPSLNGMAGDDTENNLEFSIGVEVEDSDGDVEPATITINVDDDTPVLQEVSAGAGVDLDETDAGSPSGFPISDTSVDPVINFDALFGADGPATANSIVFGLAIVGGSPEPSGLATAQGDHPITLVQIDSDTIEGQYEDGGTQVAFTIQMNADGTVTLTQEVPLEHLQDGGPAFFNDTLNLDGLIEATVTITDGDDDSTSASAPIGDNLVFFDDGPDAQVDGEATLDQLVLDETRPVGSDSDSGDNDPAGLATVQANFADNFVSPVDYGGDGAGTTAYSLLLSANGIGSGLYALDNSDTSILDGDGYGQGAEITLSQVGNVITGSAGGTDYFTISINPATGVVTFTQINNVWHADTGDDDDTSSLMTDAASNIQVVQTVTDSDGDFDTASVNIGQGVFHIEDDGPEIFAVDNTLQIDNDATPSGTGDFDFDIGTDAPNGGNDDISVSNFNVQVNGVDATNIMFNEGVENATTASYSFSFQYDTGSGGLATANGTLVFDKAAGTYTVTLDEPIAGFSLLSTGAADASDFVEYQVPSGGSGSPEVTVAQLDTDFFVQFSGVAEPGSGTGSDNLTTTTGDGGAFVPVTTASFAGLELFTQDIATIQVSNTAAGVAGNTIQGGEVLDLNLYSTDPMGTLGGVPTQSSTSMFMTLDGIGTSEDMIVVLKLYDTSTGQYTTKAIIVQNADILTDADAASLVGSPYEGLGAALDNNDGLIVIEANDYQEGNTNLVIIGAQIAGSDEGITGSGVNLNGDVGDSGGSSGTQAFSMDVSDAPFKITSIGFLTTSTEDQSATIDFDVTITDADGDSQTESITVNIGDPVSPANLPPSSLTAEAETSSFSLLASDSQEQQLQKSAANSNTLTLATAVAAAGLSAKAAAHDNGHDGHGQNSDLVNAYAPESVETFSVADDSGDAAVSMLAPEPSTEQLVPADTSSSSSSDSSSSNSLDDSPAPAADDSSGSASSVDQGPASAANDASPVAPAVAMVSAEALQAAAGVDGDAQQGSSVEQVVADALGHGDAPTVDAVLANLPGGIGELAAIAHMASPDGAAVSGWDMAANGAFGSAADMMMSMHAPNMHHDAVQPVVNG